MVLSDVEIEPHLRNQAKSLTNCSICMDQFTSPKVLPCQHTFCFVCIKRCYETINSQRLVSLTNFPCPTCRKTCYVPQGGLECLASDFRIGDILEFMNSVKDSIKSQKSKKKTVGFGCCSVCHFQRKKNVAESFCLQCEKAFCNKCLSHHAKTKIFQDHIVINDNQTNGEDVPRQNTEKCSEHEGDLKYFCEDCFTLVCAVCLLADHANHSVIEKEKLVDDMDEKFVQFSKQISSEQGRLIEVIEEMETTKEAMLTSKVNFEAKVLSAYEEALGILDNLRSHFVLSMNVSYCKSMKELEERKKKVENLRDIFKDNFNLIINARKNKGSSLFFDTFKNIKSVSSLFPHLEFEPLTTETFNFLPSVDVSLGIYEKTESLRRVSETDVNCFFDVAGDCEVNDENSVKPQTERLPLKDMQNRNLLAVLSIIITSVLCGFAYLKFDEPSIKAHMFLENLTRLESLIRESYFGLFSGFGIIFATLVLFFVSVYFKHKIKLKTRYIINATLVSFLVATGIAYGVCLANTYITPEEAWHCISGHGSSVWTGLSNRIEHLMFSYDNSSTFNWTTGSFLWWSMYDPYMDAYHWWLSKGTFYIIEILFSIFAFFILNRLFFYF